ncbi:MAG: hypothetical protein AAFN04_11330 [Pseudomonadota bacterium]
MSFGRKGLPVGAASPAAASPAAGGVVAPTPTNAAKKTDGGLPSRVFRLEVQRLPHLTSMALLFFGAVIVAGEIQKALPDQLSNLSFGDGFFLVMMSIAFLAFVGLCTWLGATIVFAPADRKRVVLEAQGVRGPRSAFSNRPVFIPYNEISAIKHTVKDKHRFFTITGAGRAQIKWSELHFPGLNAYDDFLSALEQYAWRAGVDL